MMEDVIDLNQSPRDDDAAERPYQAFFEHAPDAVIITDAAGVIVDANRQAASLFGYGVDVLVGMAVEQLLPDHLRSAHADHRAGYMTHPRLRPMGAGLELAGRRSDGSLVEVDISLSPLPGGLFAAAIRDVTARRAAESEIRLQRQRVAQATSAGQQARRAAVESEARFRSVFDASPIGMAIIDESLRFLTANPALCELLGYSATALANMTFSDVTPQEDVRRDVTLATEVFAGARRSVTTQKRYLGSHGRIIWAEVRVTLLPGEEPRALVMVSDITARKQAEADLAHRALHDDLTGVANRTLLLEHLAQALARVARGDEGVGVLFADLDRFKNVNDRLGHAAGDSVLRETATRIVAAVRPYDTVARLGGDEFVVLCPTLPADPATGLAQLTALAERIRSAVAEDIPLEGETVSVTMSVGGAAVSAGTKADPSQVLSRADAALYAAKDAGRDRSVVSADG